MNLTEYLEEAIQDLIQARTYVTTNTIPVSRSVDRITTKGDDFVDIEAETEVRLSNNHDLYTVDVAVKVVHKLQEDVNGVSIDALWADITDFVNNDLTVSALNTAITAINASSGIAIAGFDYPGAEVQTLEQYEYRQQMIQVALTFTPA